MTRSLAALLALLAVAALVALAPATAPAGDRSCDGSSCAFPRAATSRLVALGSRDCPACRHMAPVVDAAERRCGAVERLGVDEPEGAALASRHQVTRLPTLLVLDGAGRELGRLEGEQPLEALERAARDAGRRCTAG